MCILVHIEQEITTLTKTIGPYASFFDKGRGPKHFKFLLEHFKGTKAMIRGHGEKSYICEVSGFRVYNISLKFCSCF